ncbi:GDSL esterase/lipase At4g10955-like [Andrographis paniculata]|uniref:GDSL esterase/lipase At4g10955-like n=1 Tax=Andrographis paniculata TaxID=175694 RepID=UPI0021E92C7D|nr:GDSL esterase/lipase At4g10955-like [Andrographis paniculata]
MSSETDNYFLSGPTHLTVVDWSNSNHRRSVAACLVQGVYVLENDRRHRRQGPGAAMATPWWEAFNFQLTQIIVDDDQSYFGAVYTFTPPYPPPHHGGSGGHPPHHVVAFRGSAGKSGGRTEDFKTNIQCMLSNLHQSRRFQIALEHVSGVASMSAAVWLTGHSLGSSLALLIGRNFAVAPAPVHLESYLFNPPFASLPIKNEKLKTGLRFANSVLTAGLAIAAKSGAAAAGNKDSDTFAALSTWIPYLFVNQSDTVSSEYIGYFEHREKMESIGAGKIGRLATKHSVGSIISAVRGKDSEPVRLIPSGYLTVHCSRSENFREAHGIHQWWKPDLELKYKLYQIKN